MKILTTGIYIIFRGLEFSSNAEIGQKGYLRMGSLSCATPGRGEKRKKWKILRE